MEDLQLFELIAAWIEKNTAEKHNGNLREKDLPIFFDELKKRIIALKGYDPWEIRKRDTPENRDLLIALTKGFAEKINR